MWYFWLERNGRCFENKKRSMDDLRAFFFSFLVLNGASFLWDKALVLNGASFLDSL